MSTAAAANPITLAHPIIVLGRDEQGKAHASFFPAVDAYAAQAAARIMGMCALSATNDELRSYLPQLPKGKIFDSGKAFVPFVKQDLFRKLASQLPESEREKAERPRSAGDATHHAGGDEEFSTNPVPPVSLPEDWAKVVAGNMVLASEGAFDGWFEARVIEVKPDGKLRLKWRDYIDVPPFTRAIEQVALLHPRYVEK